jgi:hypothetical protein
MSAVWSQLKIDKYKKSLKDFHNAITANNLILDNHLKRVKTISPKEYASIDKEVKDGIKKINERKAILREQRALRKKIESAARAGNQVAEIGTGERPFISPPPVFYITNPNQLTLGTFHSPLSILLNRRNMQC